MALDLGEPWDHVTGIRKEGCCAGKRERKIRGENKGYESKKGD
jgi:hypothetical protein